MLAYESTAKPYKGWGMNGAVAKWYAALTKKSMEDFRALARQTAEQIPAPFRNQNVPHRIVSKHEEKLVCHFFRIAGVKIQRCFTPNF